MTTIQSVSTLPSGKAAILAKNDNDVVIVAAVRSAMTKVPSEALSSHFPGLHPLYRESVVVSRTPAQRRYSQASFVQSTPRSTSTQYLSRILALETSFPLPVARPELAWPLSTLASPSLPLSLPSTVSARLVLRPSTRSRHRSQRDRSTLALVRGNIPSAIFF